jgi:hypothetical protein
MAIDHREEISRRLRPASPPRIGDDARDPAQLRAVFELARPPRPWRPS